VSGDGGPSTDLAGVPNPCGADLLNDPNNCGMCGNVCPAGMGCAGGACACPIYQAFCGGKCIPVVNDPMNCGGCGIACTGTLACSGGKCESGCLPGLQACNNACVDTSTDNANCGTCGHTCGMGMGCVGGGCAPAVMVGPPPAKCVNGGPPIGVNNGTTTTCSGNLAQTTFTWALCSCTDVSVSSQLLTDAFDSSKGPYMPGGLGGGVGLNGADNASDVVDIWGTLWASSMNGVMSSSQNTVHLEFHSGGPVDVQGFTVGKDALVNGNINGDPMSVAGTLFVPQSATLNGNVTYGKLVRGPVTVPPPCDLCGNNAIAVAQIVASYKTMNDNALIGLDPAVFSGGGGNAARLDLPCGYYYLDALRNSQALAIVAHGHTALFIGGDINTSNPLSITVADPTSTLDLFIGGTINTSDALNLGSPQYPALMRTYVGGTAGITFSDAANIGSDFYAAAAPVSWSADAVVYGAVYVGNFNDSSAASIHYDRAVLAQGMGCPQPGPTDGGVPMGCGSCKDCGNQACINGMCSSCTDNSQCCPPLICDRGTCVVPVQ
jgi:hypothetical protein